MTECNRCGFKALKPQAGTCDVCGHISGTDPSLASPSPFAPRMTDPNAIADSGFLPPEAGGGSSSDTVPTEFLVGCPTCQMQYKVQNEHFGTQITCQNCQQTFAIAGQNPEDVELPFDSLEPGRVNESTEAVEPPEAELVEVCHDAEPEQPAEQPIKLRCPNCRKRYKIPPAQAKDLSKKVSCGKCSARFPMADGIDEPEEDAYLVSEVDIAEDE